MNFFQNLKPVIAIDGTAGSGKGTLAKKLSKKLGFDHLDTGMLYRIFAFEKTNNAKKIIQLSDLYQWLDNKNEIDKLRTDEMSKIASEISKFKYVREALVEVQRSFANNPPGGLGSVIDGRDIGTIIVPMAEVKLFVDAKVEIRAQRRIEQLNLEKLEYKTILENIRMRDFQDSNRKLSPLKKANDSFSIDTSNLSEGEVFKIALDFIRNKTDFI